MLITVVGGQGEELTIVIGFFFLVLGMQKKVGVLQYLLWRGINWLDLGVQGKQEQG